MGRRRGGCGYARAPEPDAWPSAHSFARFAAASLDVETVYYVLSSDYNLYMDIQQRINFAIMREWRGSLVAPIVMHCLHNATLLAALSLLTAQGLTMPTECPHTIYQCCSTAASGGGALVATPSGSQLLLLAGPEPAAASALPTTGPAAAARSKAEPGSTKLWCAVA